MSKQHNHLLGRLMTVALLGALTGCGGNAIKNQVAAMNQSNIQRLSNMYAAHQNYRGGRGPNDDAEFRGFIKEYDATKLKMMNIDPGNLDALFTSERDGKPFRIRYQVGGGRGSAQPVVFEQEGQDGKKQVGFTGGKVEEVDGSTYERLWEGNGPAPATEGPANGIGRPRGGSRPPVGPPPGAPTGPPGGR